MPHLRTLKRWIHLLPRNDPSEQILNQLCGILTHCTTTSKAIQRITINLAVPFDLRGAHSPQLVLC